MLSDEQKRILKIALADRNISGGDADQIIARIDREGAAVADVASADADGTYGVEEAALINENKAQINALLAALRAAGLIAS